MRDVRYSLIIPVYNGAGVIGRIVGQLLSIERRDMELIVVDDGSTDESVGILRHIAESDERLVVVCQGNAGPSAARNRGLQQARGQYIFFCDADDEVRAERLAAVMQQYEAGEAADMVVFGWEIVHKDSEGRVVARRTLTQTAQRLRGDQVIPSIVRSLGDDGRMYNLWNRMYAAHIIRQHELSLREDLRFGEDLLFNLSFISRTESVELSDATPYYIYEEDSPTSVVSVSKLQYSYRKENNRALDAFIAPRRTAALCDDGMFIKWRWLLSYGMAVAASAVSFSEQYRLLRGAIQDQKLYPRNRAGRQSLRRRIIEWCGYFLTRMPLVFLIVMRFMAAVKKRRRARTVDIRLPRIEH